MPQRHLLRFLVLCLSLVLLGACSSSEELDSSKNADTEEASFQKVDKEESIIPETDEPVEIEMVEDEEAPAVEPVPIRQEQPESPAVERQAPAVQESTPAPVAPPTPSVAPRSGAMMWSVQLGAFKNESGAFELVDELKKKFNQPVYKRYDAATGYYKVTLGSFQSRENAAEFKTDVQSRGYPDAFTVEVAR